MSSIDIEKASSEGPSTSVDTDESMQYLQTIFRELDPDSQNLDPQRYKVLKYEETKENGVAAVMDKIYDIIDQQQSSPVFAGDIVIIIYDGTAIEEDILVHLKGIDVKFTCLSGPGNCLILTMATPLHEGGTLFFYRVVVQILFMIFLRLWNSIENQITNKIRTEIWKYVIQVLVSQLPREREETSRRQLQNLLQVLKQTIQRLFPALPEQPLNVLKSILHRILNNIRTEVQIDEALEPPEIALGNLLPNLLRQLREELPNGPLTGLWDLIPVQMTPVELILPSESFKIPIFVHSVPEICSRVFAEWDIGKATDFLIKEKYYADFHGSKIPAYTVHPGYFDYIRSVQNEQLVPTATVDIGMTGNTAKVILDCLFTILGTRFQVDAAYGVDYHVNRARKMLGHIDIYHFDTSLEALDKIRKELPEKEKATVSLVIAQKAQLKYNDLRALQLLREWEKFGSADDDEYRRVRDRIAALKINYLLPYRSVHRGEQSRAPRAAALNTLKLYKDYPDDMLQMEMDKYSEIVSNCHNDVNRYWGWERSREDEMQYVREGEVILIHQIFERKTSIPLDERSAQQMQFRIKDFTGISLLEEGSTSLSPEIMGELFHQIALKFRESSLDDIEVRIPLLYDLIREDYKEAVAMLNYPERSTDQAVAALEEVYGPSSSRHVPTLKVKVRHVDFIGQLRAWNVEPEKIEYGSKLLFIHECFKRYPTRARHSPPFELSEILQGLSQSFDLGEQYGDNSHSNETETSSAGPLRQSSQSVKSRAEGPGKKLRRRSGALFSRLSSSSTNNELPRRVSQCLDKVARLRRRRILPLLLDDSLRLHLEVVERSTRLLKAFEILLKKDMSIIREILSHPSSLVPYLNDLLEKAESAESVEDDNSAERSGGR